MAKEKEERQKPAHTFFRTIKVLGFGESGFKEMVHFASWPLAALFFFVCIFFQSMPTSKEEIILFPNMVGFYAVKFAACLIIILVFYKLMGGKAKVKEFISSTSLTYTYAMILSMVLAYASILLFEMVLKISVISGVVKSFIPYYTSVLFGWCCENVSGIEKKWKAVAVGLFAITLLLVYILYIDPLLCQIGFVQMFGLGALFCGG